MKITQVDAPIYPRKVFVADDGDEKYFGFKKGIRILPAEYADNEQGTHFVFVATHEPGEKYWKDGGIECFDSSGAKRAFYTDSVIVHPSVFGEKWLSSSTTPTDSEVGGMKVVKRQNTGGKRGRKPMSPELKAIKDAEIAARAARVAAGAKRGRPIDPNKIPKPKRVNTGGKRGRKPLTPEQRALLPVKEPKVYVKTGKSRGRPKRVVAE